MAEQAQGTGGTSTGLFNFQDVLKKFYEWEPNKGPDGDDVSGEQLKNTFMGDFVQTVLNNQMAKDLAYTNAEVATGQMSTAAGLELANQSMIMRDEFNYGMQKMGAEYDYQQRFATDESNRSMNEAGLKADLQQNQTKLEGKENRLNIETQGREERNLQQTKDFGAVNQINAQGNVDVGKIKESGNQDRQTVETTGQQERLNIDSQGKVDVNKINAQGFMDQALTKVQGDQTRRNMMQQTREETKGQKRDSGMARNLAGMF